MRYLQVLFCGCIAGISSIASTAQANLAATTTSITLNADTSPEFTCGPVSTGAAACYSGFQPNGQTLSYTGPDNSGTVTGFNSYGTDPSASSSLTFSGNLDQNQFYQAESEVLYRFQVNSATNQTVNVDVSSAGSTSVNHMLGSGSGDLFAQGFLLIYQASGPVLLDQTVCAGGIPASYCSGVTPGYTGSFSVADTLSVLTNTQYIVDLDTNVGLMAFSNNTVPDLSASSSIDPTITLASTDPAYSLQFSPVAAPEPCSLLLVGTGIVTSIVCWRRRWTDSVYQ